MPRNKHAKVSMFATKYIRIALKLRSKMKTAISSTISSTITAIFSYKPPHPFSSLSLFSLFLSRFAHSLTQSLRRQNKPYKCLPLCMCVFRLARLFLSGLSRALLFFVTFFVYFFSPLSYYALTHHSCSFRPIWICMSSSKKRPARGPMLAQGTSYVLPW